MYRVAHTTDKNICNKLWESCKSNFIKVLRRTKQISKAQIDFKSRAEKKTHSQLCIKLIKKRTLTNTSTNLLGGMSHDCWHGYSELAT